MMKKDGTCLRKHGMIALKPAILLRIYRIMKKHPKRVYIMRDFGIIDGKRGKIYLKTLEHLNIIENVACYYDNGKYKIRRRVNGWKIR